MSTQKGRATIFGITGTVVITGLASFTPISDSNDFSQELNKSDVKDTDGKMISRIYSGLIFNGKLSFTPVAASGTNTIANAAASAYLPTPGTKVTLASFGNTNIDGDWIYDGGWHLSYKKGDLATYEFDIMKSGEGVDLTITAT